MLISDHVMHELEERNLIRALRLDERTGHIHRLALDAYKEWENPPPPPVMSTTSFFVTPPPDKMLFGLSYSEWQDRIRKAVFSCPTFDRKRIVQDVLGEINTLWDSNERTVRYSEDDV